mgnify:CR=1 FL=1
MESCFPNYFNYFSSSRMHILLPAVTVVWTGYVQHRQQNNKQNNNKLSVAPLLLLSLAYCAKSYLKHSVPNQTPYYLHKRKQHIQRGTLLFQKDMSASGLESSFCGFFASFLLAAAKANGSFSTMISSFLILKLDPTSYSPIVYYW